jgi:hypothetical protein
MHRSGRAANPPQDNVSLGFLACASSRLGVGMGKKEENVRVHSCLPKLEGIHFASNPSSEHMQKEIGEQGS